MSSYHSNATTCLLTLARTLDGSRSDLVNHVTARSLTRRHPANPFQDFLAAYHASLGLSPPLKTSSSSAAIFGGLASATKMLALSGKSRTNVLSPDAYSSLLAGSQRSSRAGTYQNTTYRKSKDYAMRGYLMKRKIEDGLKVLRWNRYYFYIQLPEGFLMQHNGKKDPTILADLRTSSVRGLAGYEERDNVIEITSGPFVEILLQTETDAECRDWTAALFACQGPKKGITGLLSRQTSMYPLPSPRYVSAGKLHRQHKSSGALLDRVYDTPFSNDSAALPPLAPLRASSDDFSTVKSGILHLRATFAYLKANCLTLHWLETDARSMKQKSLTGGSWRRVSASLKSDGLVHLFDEQDQIHLEPIHLPDLPRSYIHTLSATLHPGRDTFAVRTSLTHVHHLAADSGPDRDSWCSLMKCFAVPEVVGLSIDPNEKATFAYRYHRTLSVRIVEGRDIVKGSDAGGGLICEVVVDGDRKVRTGGQRGEGPPFWREQVVGHRTHKVRHHCPRRTFIPVRSIVHGETPEYWHPIEREARQSTFAGHVANLGQAHAAHRRTERVGELRVAVRYEEHIVLPLAEYEELTKFLLNLDNIPVLHDLAGSVPDLERLAETLLRIYDSHGVTLPWICAMADREVAMMAVDDVNILFRGNSLLTKSIDVYMKMVGLRYLDDTIGDIVRKICRDGANIEVDPTRLDKHDDMRVHWRTLLRYMGILWEAINNCKESCPSVVLLPLLIITYTERFCLADATHFLPSAFPCSELRAIFAHLQTLVVSRFTIEDGKRDDRTVRHPLPQALRSRARYIATLPFSIFPTLSSSNILSSLSIPAITSDRTDHPDTRTSRTLTLLAKSLMSFTNLVDPGVKEPWMANLNGFISVSGFKGFLRHCNIPVLYSVASQHITLYPDSRTDSLRRIT
ncbi:hypothetical protein BC938DRAFT_484228 [Jimgerdemannia flammicorona]|uniref:PH domain-containing protein n=1 Tax=Jimgerdemannia flammicorona TaxID=994334 RepID=A0A433QA91_9FUNG|nr:hypothetical protein BC938DRAFT_484228 [Jimgerdemannia flammicorona]